MKRRLFTLDPSEFIYDSGFAWIVRLPLEIVHAIDSKETRTLVALIEDGIDLALPQTEHCKIREVGMGTYSHWGGNIWFSSSDNTSPRTNGRCYQVYVEHDRKQWWHELSDFPDPECLPPFERFCLARRAYKLIWPQSRLPDFGRKIDTDKVFESELSRVCPEADYSYERKYDLDQIFKLIVDVEGDVAECGTYKGASAYFIARNIIDKKMDKKLFLFDSFSGLSAPGVSDGEWWKEGDLSSSIDDVRSTLKILGNTSFIHILDGWIPSRFEDVAERKFCFVHIDVDLAEPTLHCLTFFYDRLSFGGIIFLDDYGHSSCPGVTDVVDSFLKDRKAHLCNLASGAAFIISYG